MQHEREAGDATSGVQVAFAFILICTLAGAIAGGVGALFAVGDVARPVAVIVVVAGGYTAAQVALFASCLMCWGAESAVGAIRTRWGRPRLPRARVVSR